MKRRYGWIRDRVTDRKPLFSAPHFTTFPSVLSWRNQLPQCYDQGLTSSCTGNGVAAALAFDEIRAGAVLTHTPSRKFIYWNGRAEESDTQQDQGARIADVVDALGTLGYCPEVYCPFTDLTTPPTPEAFAVAHQKLVGNRQSIAQTESAIKQALMSGRLVVAGMLVYQSMEGEAAAATGIVPLPTDIEPALGGHCVCIIGWDDSRKMWECRNSWGSSWGDSGNFWVPYSYFTNPQLSSDLTVVF